MKKIIFIPVLLLVLVFLAGCTNRTYTGEGVVINLEANPKEVFENSNTRVFIDVENKDIKTMNRVFIDIFDSGNFDVAESPYRDKIKLDKTVPPEGSGERACPSGTPAGTCNNLINPNAKNPYYCDSKGCSWNRCDICGCPSGDCLPTGSCGYLNPCSRFLTGMKVKDVQTLECDLKAKPVPYVPYKSKISARVRYETNFSAVQIIEMMTEEWYQSHKLAEDFQRHPKSYTFNDKNIQLDLEFSDELPIVVKQGKQAFVNFKLKNIGNGFIYGIRSADFKIIQSGDILKDCGIASCAITPVGKDFPVFACELNMPDNINYLSNYIIIINIKYAYEVREELPIEIIR